jgi:hypothetical protein
VTQHVGAVRELRVDVNCFVEVAQGARQIIFAGTERTSVAEGPIVVGLDLQRFREVADGQVDLVAA